MHGTWNMEPLRLQTHGARCRGDFRATQRLVESMMHTSVFLALPCTEFVNMLSFFLFRVFTRKKRWAYTSVPRVFLHNNMHDDRQTLTHQIPLVISSAVRATGQQAHTALDIITPYRTRSFDQQGTLEVTTQKVQHLCSGGGSCCVQDRKVVMIPKYLNVRNPR